LHGGAVQLLLDGPQILGDARDSEMKVVHVVYGHSVRSPTISSAQDNEQMSHGHAPFVILDITLDGKKSLRPNAATGAPFHGYGAAAAALVTTDFPMEGKQHRPH
jgi:hypothetical protein